MVILGINICYPHEKHQRSRILELSLFFLPSLSFLPSPCPSSPARNPAGQLLPLAGLPLFASLPRQQWLHHRRRPGGMLGSGGRRQQGCGLAAAREGRVQGAGAKAPSPSRPPPSPLKIQAGPTWAKRPLAEGPSSNSSSKILIYFSFLILLNFGTKHLFAQSSIGIYPIMADLFFYLFIQNLIAPNW